MEAISIDEVKEYEAKFEARIRPASDLLTGIVGRRSGAIQDVIGKPHSSWQTFNQHFGGTRGELTVITADTNVGKSTFARAWLVDQVEQGRSSLLLSLEDKMQEVADAMAQMITGKDIFAFTDDDMSRVADEFKKWPLLYLDYNGTVSAPFIFKLIDYAVQKRGVEFIVIDHLDYIQKQWNGRNEAYVIGDLIRTLAGRSNYHNCAIVIIVHPSKRGDHGVVTREVGIDELKGSSSIKQEAHNVFGLQQPNPAEPITYLRFLKIKNRRFGRSRKAKIGFKFDPKFLRFHEVSNKLEWGE